MLDWVESTDLSTAIREGALYYPALGGIHLLGIAVFGGMIIATDLRLLGWAMRRRLVADVVEQSRPWKQGWVCTGCNQRLASDLGGTAKALSQSFVLDQARFVRSCWRARLGVPGRRLPRS